MTEMKKNKMICSFSGGRTSAYLVHLLEKKRISDGWDVEYVFMDTGAEHPKTYEFVRNVVEHYGIDLTVLKTKINKEMGVGPTYEVHSIDSIGWDLSIFNELTNKYGNPFNPGGGFCTDKLKTVTFQKYLKANHQDATTWIGIRVDEPRRLKSKKGIRYLAELSRMDKTDIMGWWKQMPFDLELQEHLGNCVFCIKKGVNKIALAIKDEPKLAKEWSQMLETSRDRSKDPEVSKLHIYRGKMSMDGIAKFYADIDRDWLHNSMNHAKRFETGSCSDSCEAFGCQADLFDNAV